MVQKTLKEYMNFETIYVDSSVIFSHIKSLINNLHQKKKPLSKRNIKQDMPHTLLTKLNKKYLLYITDLVEKEVLINLVKSIKEKGCDLEPEKAKFVFKNIFEKFQFVQEDIIKNIKLNRIFFKFCLDNKISIMDAIHVLAAIKRHIKIATSDKKLRWKKDVSLNIYKPQDLLN